MNREAERHIDKAVSHVERGETYYGKAADEIIAAQQADPTLSNREIGERMGRSRDWVRELVRWRTTDASSRHPSPYSGQADSINLRKTKQVLREAPLEQVEQIVESLPRERQQAIAAAAGDAYLGARQQHDEHERSLTRDERREREQAGEQLARPARRAVGDFASLGIAEHLEQAVEELHELVADASLTPAALARIERAYEALTEALTFARELVGGREQS